MGGLVAIAPADTGKYSKQQYQAVSVPVLVMYGERDKSKYREEANYWLEEIPWHTNVMVPKAEHAAFMGNPNDFQKEILRFLATECQVGEDSQHTEEQMHLIDEYMYPIIELQPISTNERLLNKTLGAAHNSQGNALMFMHIPKTGGTNMAKVALKHEIYWITKMFQENKVRGFKNIFCDVEKYAFCSGLADRVCTYRCGGGSIWHIPLRWWTDEFMKDYKAPPPTQRRNSLQWYFDSGNTDWFCIVRNPFSKVISEYKWRESFWGGQTNCSADAMNEWMARNLLGNFDNHMTPQKEYVFDASGKQIVEHIIHFENQMEELEKMFWEYNMNDVYQTWLHTRGYGKCRNLKPKHISESNRQIIRERYKEDFETFGYSMEIK